MKLCFSLWITLLLGSVCLLKTPVSTETVITCDNGSNVQHLSCGGGGVIQVTAAIYGRTNKEICSEGRPPQQLVNTECSQKNTVVTVKNRCEGKKECEYNTQVFRTSDPCFGIFKYVETNYTCIPAIRAVACEGSSTKLFCDGGQALVVVAAYYGRTDRTTCSFGRSEAMLRNVNCPGKSSRVAASCNGRSACTVTASNTVFGETCAGTYKYLEVAYLCEYNSYPLRISPQP